MGVVEFYNFIQSPLGLLILSVWILPWKGVALWRAARLRDKWWFIGLLIVNTLGALEIMYIFVWSKRASLAFSHPEK